MPADRGRARSPGHGAVVAPAGRGAILPLGAVASEAGRAGLALPAARGAVLLLCAWLLGPVPAVGQLAEGQVAGTVTDQSGRPVAEAIVTLEGGIINTSRSAVASQSGRFWFPAVPPGRYTLHAIRREPALGAGSRPTASAGAVESAEFAVEIGGLVDVTLVLGDAGRRPAGPGAGLGPQSALAAPAVESRALGRDFDIDWLRALPLARDPWWLVEQAPGLLTDPLPGGAPGVWPQSWSARGAEQNLAWNVDGATVTDVVSWGSPADVAFAAIGQARVQTAGHGPSVQGPGPSLDVVTRAGTNRLATSGHGIFSGRGLEATNLTDSMREQLVDPGDQLLAAHEIGAEAGGPIVTRRAWFFASMARTGRTTALHGIPVGGRFGAGAPYDPDALVHHTVSADDVTGRFDTRVAPGHDLAVTASVARRRRSPVDPSRDDAPESWRYESGTAPLVRVSHHWIAGPLAMTSRASYADRGSAYELHDPSLADVQPLQDQSTQGWSRSGRVTRFDRRMFEARTEASFFATRAGWGDHRVSAGIRFRLDRDGEWSHVAGDATANLLKQVPSGATLYRDGDRRHSQTSFAVHVGDRVAFGRFTLDAGLRVDVQDDRSGPSLAPANPLLPEALPEVRVGTTDSGVTFVDVVPRVGLTWSPGTDGKTAVRLSVAGYAAPGNRTSAWIDPSGPTAVWRPWSDPDGDRFVQRGELIDATALQVIIRPVLLDPPPLTIDPELSSPRTRELVAGVTRRLPSGLVAEAAYIDRRDDRPHTRFIDGVTSADFVPITVATIRCEEGRCGPGSPTVTYYDLPFMPPEGRRVFNGSRRSVYRGLELSLRRPYHRRLRVSATLTLNETAIRHPGPDSYQDPTRIPFEDGRGPAAYNARWDSKANVMVVLPWGLTTAAAINGRDGYPFVKAIEIRSRRYLGGVTVPVEPIGSSRYGSVWTIDWKLQKRLPLGRVGLEVSLEVFNLANVATVLRRETHQDTPTAGMPMAIVPPRVARIGVTIGL